MYRLGTFFNIEGFSISNYKLNNIQLEYCMPRSFIKGDGNLSGAYASSIL